MLKQFQEHVHNKFNRYAFGFFLCEVTNLLFAFLNIYMTDVFLNYQFFNYGISALDALIVSSPKGRGMQLVYRVN